MLMSLQTYFIVVNLAVLNLISDIGNLWLKVCVCVCVCVSVCVFVCVAWFSLKRYGFIVHVSHK